MKALENTLLPFVKTALNKVYQIEAEDSSINFQQTRKGFDGEITLVCFPFTKQAKSKPQEIAEKIGSELVESCDLITNFNVAQGFLNIEISKDYWKNFLLQVSADEQFGFKNIDESQESTLVEYSSPNTNKPLHLGHIRNILLGFSVSQIQQAAGYKSTKVQIINDRGIHICKSMYAWQQDKNPKTPENSGLKGDKLVGHYYVAFDKQYKKEVADLMASGKTEEKAKAEAPSIIAAREMLRKWEAGDSEVTALWEKMNTWVYDGFNTTYNRLGVYFDKNYFESDTYLLGKEVVQQGLDKGVFYRKEDGSVWCDLTEEGLDEKIVLRADGTAVYMTQDIGTAIQRFKDFKVDKQIYTVGNEQDYHFQVLFLILNKLGYDWAKRCFHLSYGMVDLPSGKMKSREGTVVDADDLLDEMHQTAKQVSDELGKLEGFDEEEKSKLFEWIGQGALKYYILKVDPKKRILFDPSESIDFAGNTGPFIQYTHARICSILRKGNAQASADGYTLQEKEVEVVQQISMFPDIIQQAAVEYSPALLANYLYDLVKVYNQFYQSIPIWSEEDAAALSFRLSMSKTCGNIIKNGMSLLGIQVPERM